jgi:MFS family permease
LRDYTVREAMHTRAYWLMMLGAGLRMTAALGILVSIVPILESKGVSRQAAANMTGIMFGINFMSRLLLGYFADRWDKSYILAITLGFECLGFVALFFGEWTGAAAILILLFILFEGFGDGSGIIVWAALGDYFGRDRFASLRGYITFSHSWAMVASPVFAGWAFDHFGNYDWALGPAAVCSALASLCFFLCKKPPQLTREAPEPVVEAGPAA